MLAHHENGQNARALFAKAGRQHHVEPGQLIVHADRGSAPTAKTLAKLFADLGVERSYSRPHVSDDNPYYEAQFKTLKYAPGYPSGFGSYEDARAWCRQFFPWYNTEHCHSVIAYMTPEMIHYGRTTDYGSTDSTLSIAENMVMLSHRNRCQGCAAPRNLALEGVTWSQSQR